MGDSLSVNKTVAERIGKIRTDRGETQAQLARALNVDRTTVANWETCRRSVSIESLFDISKHYNVSMDYLTDINVAEPSKEPNIKALSEYTGLSRKAIDTIANYNNHCKNESVWNSLNAILESESYNIKLLLPRLFDSIRYAKQAKQLTEEGFKVDLSNEDNYLIEQLKKKGCYLIPLPELEARFKDDAIGFFTAILDQLLDSILPEASRSE